MRRQTPFSLTLLRTALLTAKANSYFSHSYICKRIYLLTRHFPRRASAQLSILHAVEVVATSSVSIAIAIAIDVTNEPKLSRYAVRYTSDCLIAKVDGPGWVDLP